MPDSSYLNACGRTHAWFREHTYRSDVTYGPYISSGWLSDKEMNANVLNTSSGRWS